jgi:hypothetical protein
VARVESMLDRATQRWVKVTGRRVDLADHEWLRGPIGAPDVIGDEWVTREASTLGATVQRGGGLLASMSVLESEEFDSTQLAPLIRDFYEHTAEWHLDVWSQWSAAAWPFGWLISSLFGRRLSQLSLPLRPLDAANGMDSRVLVAMSSTGQQVGAAWLRTLRKTGQTVYSGWYGRAQLPGSSQPSIRVVFPLPNGSVTVFLRPAVEADGSLKLRSTPGDFGTEGTYLIVRDGPSHGAVRRVPIHEEFRVFVDDDGILRTDHALHLGRAPVIRFHYRLTKANKG